MPIYDEAYNEKLLVAWQHFIEGADYDYSFIRTEIIESWERSRSYLVDPYHSKTNILPHKDLQKRIEADRLLIDVSRPYMEKLYSVVRGSGFYILLVDKDGYIIDLLGDDAIIEHGRCNTMLVVGANRSEQYAGTNAIGTGLVLKKPLQMWGGEHYIKSHKDFSCSSAPIFDTDGTLLGCLNLTGLSRESHLHTLGMVMSAVDGISNEIKLRKAYQELEMVSNQRNCIIEAMASGLFLVNKHQEITQANSIALSMLNLGSHNVIGKKLYEVMRFDDPYANNSLAIENEFYNKEINIFPSGAYSDPLKYNVSVNFVLDHNGKTDGMVLQFNETKKINRLVNRIGGYKPSFTFNSIVGSSQIMRNTIHTCQKAAHTGSNVLILGESGTGKELIAQSIHNASSYSSGPFVAINCGALPRGLVESELFGYEKGAFTGANKDGNPGKFELADGGTLLLDEIGEMPLDVQVTLLRVLETKQIMRIGSKYPKSIDVRVIASTNRDLRKSIADQTFRSDLFYRLNVFSVELPPLRERGHDICELADHFVNTFNLTRRYPIRISADVYPLLLQYSWPGNIRELENAIERAINITEDGLIRPEHLPGHITAAVLAHPSTNQEIEPLSDPTLNLESTGYQLILSSLEKSDGNVKKAAELLGISRRTLYRKMDKYNIPYSKYR